MLSFYLIIKKEMLMIEATSSISKDFANMYLFLASWLHNNAKSVLNGPPSMLIDSFEYCDLSNCHLQQLKDRSCRLFRTT